MKKIIKFLLFVSSFVFFIVNVSAGACDAHAIVTKNSLYDFDWAVPMDNICQLTKKSSDYNGSCGTKQAAIDHCKGTSVHPCTGAVSYNVNGCSEKSICNCYTFRTVCEHYPEQKYVDYSCDSDNDGKEDDVCSKLECGPDRYDTKYVSLGGEAGKCYKDQGSAESDLEATSGAECQSKAGDCGAFFTFEHIKDEFKVQYPVYTCDATTGARGYIDSIYDFEHQTPGDFGGYNYMYGCFNSGSVIGVDYRGSLVGTSSYSAYVYNCCYDDEQLSDVGYPIGSPNKYNVSKCSYAEAVDILNVGIEYYNKKENVPCEYRFGAGNVPVLEKVGTSGSGIGTPGLDEGGIF